MPFLVAAINWIVATLLAAATIIGLATLPPTVIIMGVASLFVVMTILVVTSFFVIIIILTCLGCFHWLDNFWIEISFVHTTTLGLTTCLLMVPFWMPQYVESKFCARCRVVATL